MRFIFKLALALGKTVNELLSTLDSVELTYWRAYYRIDPFGQDRNDLANGIVAATVANCHRSRNTDAYKASQFMYEYKPTATVEQTPEEVAKQLDNMMGSFLAKPA